MTLPLFPLNTVLFPGCTLDLQIFEARYLDMIGRCMKQGEGFGVVSIVEGRETGLAAHQHAVLGCEALIVDFQQQDNGLLGIRVQGGRRFQVDSSEVLRDQLIVGQVHWLEEQPERPLDDEHEDLAALLTALAEHPMVAALDMTQGADGQQSLSYQLAYLLPFTDPDKLKLLRIDDPEQRLECVQTLLDGLQGELAG